MEINIIKAIQSIKNGFFDLFFEGITILGEELVYILIFSILYWCISKREAIKLIIIFMVSGVINNSLKELINRDRPIGIEGIISMREQTATGKSMPSGHTQLAATFYYYLIVRFKKLWITIAASILIGLIALSRVYLGVHWPSDVVVSIILAIGIVHAGLYLYNEPNKQVLVSTLVIANLLLVIFFSEDLLVATAILTGAIIGLFIEMKYVNFTEKTSLKVQILKVVIGLVGVVLIKEGLKIIVDNLTMDYIRYTLLGIWVAAGAPYLFRFIGGTK